MNNDMSNGASSNGFAHVNPVDKLEGAFMSCLAAITKEDTLTNVDKDEIRVDVEQGLTNFVDQARAMEGYFLKKRLEIAAQKPELIIKDDASELRFELLRKDDLLKKNYDKINFWQTILADLQSGGTPQGKPTQPPPPPVVTGINQPLQGPATPGAQGPLTPSSGRPNTPASVGRPITPVSATAGSRMHPGSGNPHWHSEQYRFAPNPFQQTLQAYPSMAMHQWYPINPAVGNSGYSSNNQMQYNYGNSELQPAAPPRYGTPPPPYPGVHPYNMDTSHYNSFNLYRY